MASEPSILISTKGGPGYCASCRGNLDCLAYVLDGFATTAQIADGILSSGLTGISFRLRLWLCKPCLEVIAKGKRLTLEG